MPAHGQAVAFIPYATPSPKGFTRRLAPPEFRITTTSLPHVALPEGKIHLAGEHTSVWIDGWMQGALESGNRVAREVNDSAPPLDASHLMSKWKISL